MSIVRYGIPVPPGGFSGGRTHLPVRYIPPPSAPGPSGPATAVPPGGFRNYTPVPYTGAAVNMKVTTPTGPALKGWRGWAMGHLNGGTGEFLSRRFNLFGHNTSYGRAGLTAGLGLLALRNAGNMMDRMRYGDYGGAMLSGAMTAAAGYGAYRAWMFKGSMMAAVKNNIARAVK